MQVCFQWFWLLLPVCLRKGVRLHVKRLSFSIDPLSLRLWVFRRLLFFSYGRVSSFFDVEISEIAVSIFSYCGQDILKTQTLSASYSLVQMKAGLLCLFGWLLCSIVLRSFLSCFQQLGHLFFPLFSTDAEITSSNPCLQWRWLPEVQAKFSFKLDHV